MPSTYDPIQQLTIAELDTASRLLKADIVQAIHGATVNRWAGMAIVACVLARRTDPSASLGTYRAMTPAELTAALGYPGDDSDDLDDAGDQLAGQLDLDDAAAQLAEPVPSGAAVIGAEGDGLDLSAVEGADSSVSANESAGAGLDELQRRASADPTARTRA